MKRLWRLIKIERLWLYVYVCRRPSGWGRHYGYTGITNSLFHRGRQHEAKPWHSLVIKRRTIYLGRIPRGLGLALEWLLIKATRPVYNVQHNKGNSRRIKPWDAKAARLARDASRTPVMARVKDVLSFAPVLGAVVLAAGLWMGVFR